MNLPVRITSLSFEVLWSTLRRGIRMRAFLAHVSDAGWGSLFFIAITLGFIGVIGVYQTAEQMKKVIPEFSLLGAATLQLLVREFAPIVTGLMVSTKVGTGLAAEVGSMVVTDQVDAMRLCGADPIEELVVPRVWGTVVAMVGLAALGGVVAYGAGMWSAWASFDVPAETFISLRFVKMPDLWVGLSKAVIFGFSIPVVSIACGLEAKGGSEGVGEATTRAVVWSSFSVIFLDLVVGALAEVLGWTA
jgi:phospholipid/cholesterol/gamma-HCH transport system permease protein